MRVCEIIERAQGPLFTFELLPPLKGETIDSIYQAIETLLPYNPAYINITNHQMETIYTEREDGLLERHSTRKRPGTIGLAAAIQYKYGVEVVPHLICGGVSAEQIEDELSELIFLEIENVLVLRGDPPHGEKRFSAVQGGHAHSDSLVKQIATNQWSAAKFCIGVAGYPEKHIEAPNMESDIAMLKQKIESGAHYIVTQMFFENSHYFNFVKLCREAGIEVPIIPGIKPLQRKRDLELLPQTFSIEIPSRLVKAVEKCSSAQEIREVGKQFCIEQVEELLASNVAGIHFYTQGRSKVIAEVVEATYPHKRGYRERSTPIR
ncbi:MAG: methylenetetrahydrofolate reductase [Sphaerochaetaceae bacterium]